MSISRQRGATASTGSVDREARLRAPAQKRRYAFVVTTARSGSTLLRYLLDSHPEIACPPELNLSAYLQHTVDLWSRVDEAVHDLPEAPPGAPPGAPPRLAPAVRRKGRRAIDSVASAITGAKGATVFCDKSLTTVDQLRLVAECYPDAHYVFLYRYPLDVIASGIEASRWGFNAYGFAPYVGTAPGNFVAGLANYWADKVSAMLEFERTTELTHARIYYELLCDDPAGTLGDLFDFLGVKSGSATVEAVLGRVFADEHGLGPGDYKIDFTGSIRRDSIGRGSLLPRLVPPVQARQIDELLAELDYPSLDAAWQGDLATLIGLKPLGAGPAPSDDLARLAAEMGTLVEAGVTGLRPEQSKHLLPLELVVHGPGGQRVVTLDASGHVTGGNGRAGAADPARPERGGAGGDHGDHGGRGVVRIHCEGGVLAEVAAGRVNLAQLLQDGRLRVDRPEPGAEGARLVPRRALRALAAALGGA